MPWKGFFPSVSGIFHFPDFVLLIEKMRFEAYQCMAATEGDPERADEKSPQFARDPVRCVLG
jgi:hypothetical protein